MRFEDGRATFTLRDLLALLAIAGILAAITAIYIPASREGARQAACENKLRAIGSGLQKFDDAYRGFPRLTHQTQPGSLANVWATTPGAISPPGIFGSNGYTSSPKNAAGYSWIVRILWYIDRGWLGNEIASASDLMRIEAFEPVMINWPATVPFLGAAKSVEPFPNRIMPELVCPSFGGSPRSTASTGMADPAVSIPAYAALFSSTATAPLSLQGVAITNYVALSGTHLACMATDPALYCQADAQAVERPNGVIVPEVVVRGKDVVDGLSKTLMVCETREPAVNSWYDGTVCWTVGANPSASRQPTRDITVVGVDGQPKPGGEWIFPQGTTDACAINYGPHGGSKKYFAPNGTTAAQTQPVSWGPSSEHSAGIVMHLVADGSVVRLTGAINPNLYLHLITRAGSESAVVPRAD